MAHCKNPKILTSPVNSVGCLLGSILGHVFDSKLAKILFCFVFFFQITYLALLILPWRTRRPTLASLLDWKSTSTRPQKPNFGLTQKLSNDGSSWNRCSSEELTRVGTKKTIRDKIKSWSYQKSNKKSELIQRPSISYRLTKRAWAIGTANVPLSSPLNFLVCFKMPPITQFYDHSLARLLSSWIAGAVAWWPVARRSSGQHTSLTNIPWRETPTRITERP